jgi:uracil DNA glycosylase
MCDTLCSRDGTPTELNKEYFSLLKDERTPILLIIMGESPYPNDPGNIPFIKSNWNLMSNHNSSGYLVLESVTDTKIEDIQNHCSSKKISAEKYACDILLKKYKIALLNASYCYRNGKGILKEDVRFAWENINKAVVDKVLKKDGKIVLCGKQTWKAKNWIPDLQNNQVFLALHPSQRSTKNRNDDKWRDWWTRGAIYNNHLVNKIR